MTARALEIDGHTTHEFSGRWETAAGDVTRYRLEVIATDVADVVRSAGGWLFDRARSGWDVNVLVARPSDVRALRILGVHTGPLETTAQSAATWPRAQAIAVAADAFNADARVREIVASALERGLTEVTLWGDAWPAELHRRAGEVRHHLSAAARAFKSHAVAAARLPSDPIGGSERFRSGSQWCRTYETDLVPVG